MKLKKLVVLDKNDFNETQRQDLKTLAGEVIVFDDMPKDDNEAIVRIGDADAVIVCWYSINKAIIDSCPNLKYLSVVATGYEWVDVDYAIQKGIIVTNVPAYVTEAVTDYIFKQLDRFDIKNKTLGIVGLGDIGKKAAEIGQSKGLNVIYWNRIPKETNFKYVGLDEIFKKADIIALLLKLNSDTERIIKNKYLDLMKEDSIIVNIVSPKLFEDVNYLIEIATLKNIKLILDFEDDGKLSELSKINRNIIYTPHIAWKSVESIYNLSQIAIENVKSYIQGENKNKIIL